MHEQNSGSSGDPKGSPLFWARQVPSWIRWRLRSGGPRTQPSGANPKVTGSNPVPATIESPVTSGACLLGSNGLEVVLPTRCPQESVQIHSVRSLPVLLRLPLARDGVVSEASARYSFRADSGGGVPPWESAQPCNGPRALRPASASFLSLIHISEPTRLRRI